MIYLLEYNDTVFQYHYNCLDNTHLHFQDELFSNDWEPICIVDNDLYMDRDFDDLTDWVRDQKFPYQKAYSIINMWVINRMEGRKLKVPENK